ALDWRMPEGTPILAARGGVVTEVVDHFAESGLTHEYFNRANYVVIRHEDNTCALYAHSPRQGIMVRAGDTVRAGQQIAVAGNTGFSVESHLHFEVYRMEGDSKVTLPTLFLSGAAEPLEIFRGAKYRAPHIAGIHDPALAGRFVPDADAVAAPPGAATTAQTAFGREFMAFRERLLQHARGPEPVAAARRVLRDLQESSGAANGLWRDLNRQATAGDRVAQGDLAVLMNAMSLEHEPDIARLQTDDNAAPVMDEAMILWWQMYAL
ncbi:MAG TPA: M23 family metallopeptidase, partial [bacterium]|nr:M23 family metallopeptidase [bacterium]